MFAEKFLEILINDAEKMGMSGVDLAKCAWPDMPHPDQKWQRIKNISTNIQKRQSLKLSDAYMLVRAINQDMARFCLRVLTELERTPNIKQTANGTGHIQIGGSVGGSITCDTRTVPPAPKPASKRQKQRPGRRRR